MVDQNELRAEAFGNIEQQAAQLLRFRFVEPGTRLVQQDRLGPPDQCLADFDHPAFVKIELTARYIRPRRQTDEGHRLVDLVPRVVAARRDMIGDRLNVLARCQFVDDKFLLEGAPQPGRDTPHRRQSLERNAVEMGVALHGGNETRQHIEQRGLAGAVGADKAADRRLELAVERIERPHAAELHGQGFDLDHDPRRARNFA